MADDIKALVLLTKIAAVWVRIHQVEATTTERAVVRGWDRP